MKNWKQQIKDVFSLYGNNHYDKIFTIVESEIRSSMKRILNLAHLEYENSVITKVYLRDIINNILELKGIEKID